MSVLWLGPLTADEKFVDVARELGVNFETISGAMGKRYLVETMLAGAAWLDYDLDGFLDLYLVQGHAHPETALEKPGDENATGNVLYRNAGGRRFEDVTDRAGVASRAYGMGAAAGDYDNDGYPDLYVTNYGPNTLYHNRRDGSFEDVTGAAGVGIPAGAARPPWSTSATWADFDGDGLLDLYVVHYLDYDTRIHGACKTTLPGTQKQVDAYCHPSHFSGAADSIYRNLGGGKFIDLSRQSGIAARQGWQEAKGLGAVASDFDGDGDPDILVANDTVANTLWRNLGGFRFEDVALQTGFAFDADGSPEACMGIARADIDGNGFLDYFVTNFSRETNTLYLNHDGFFLDATVECNLAQSGYLELGFGTCFLDFDLDGDMDLYVANGHILDNVELLHPGEGITYAQRDLLFENTGSGKFADVSGESGEWFLGKRVGRCVVEGDFDNDGDGDLIVTTAAGKAALLENRAGNGKNWVGASLRSPRAVHGAWVTLETSGRRQLREVQTDGSYLGAGDPRVRFGLPPALQEVTLRVRWPGKTRAVDYPGLRAGRYHVLDAPSH